ncbi:hypothetical protein MSAN_00133400 [Mycena sanguinolenta]|uniref:Uncharacterized protein n=1 Tax=Mycena sanguinolenta TaxID=230812 RepID=A0A8H7DLW2_9AGAR|nr:hypothetical protein MSAN_00133400 [Mycena sanguinolenta]
MYPQSSCKSPYLVIIGRNMLKCDVNCQLVTVGSNYGQLLILVFPDADFKLKDGPLLTKNALINLAKALDRTFVHLRRLFLVCSQTYVGRCGRPLLRRKDARCFANVMSRYNSAPFLRTFHFSAVDGYVEVTRWGGLDERREDIDTDSEWDEVYSRPAVIFRVEDYAYLFP